ncbi:hypothetical protein JZ751_019735, partial [Albula glossodonta]
YRAEDTVTQLREDITGFVGESVTLSCNYSTRFSLGEVKLVNQTEGQQASMDCTFDINRSNYNRFYWYRQYPGSAPQYILYRGSSSGTADFAKDRFESTADENSGKTVLTIKKLISEDSAMYYCALCTSAHSGTS